MEELHRVFVGGLFDSITEEELSTRFQSFGDVRDVTVVQKNDGEGNITKTFGYVNLVTTTQKLNRCFAVFGGTKWKGHELKVQLAKEDFIARLKRERDEPVVKKKKKKHSSGPLKTYDDILETASGMKKIVPGTPVEGERNWVIGKYGRPLPIVHISKIGGRKTMKVDPSKFCHCVRKIADVDDGDVNVDKLTWTCDDGEMNVIQKKKKGECMEKENNYADKVDSTRTDETVDTNDIKKHKKKKKKETVALADDPSAAVNDVSKPKKRKHKDEEVENLYGNSTSVGVSQGNAEVVDALHPRDVTESTNQDTPQKQRKKKKRDKGNEIISSPSTVVNNNSVNNASDGSACLKNKRKKQIESAEQDALPEGNTERLTPTSEPKESESQEKHKPEMVFFEGLQDNTSDELSNKNNENSEKVLGISVIAQLLSSSRKNKHCLSTKDTPPINGGKGTSEVVMTDNNDSKSSEEPDENLFDFELEAIGGKKNQSFLDTLMNNVEVREDVNAGYENSSSDESVEDSDNSTESFAKDDNDKTTTLNSECVLSVDVSEVKHVDKSTDLNQQIDTDKEVKNVGTCNSNIGEVESTDTNKKVKKSKVLNSNKEEILSELADTGNKIKKSKISNSNKQEKHALSEEQRKKSLEVRNSQILQNKDLVKKALQAVDNKSACNGNRIVFDESGDEEVSPLPVTGTERNENKLWSDNEDENESVPLNETVADDNSVRKHSASLFDDGSDDEEVDFQAIKIKPQFQGKEGEKLFKMQQRFKGDERFRLDERFAEDDDKGDCDEDNEQKNMNEFNSKIDSIEEGEMGNEADDLLKEKQMNISLLEQVLGKPLKLEKKQSDYTIQRYDPENIEHEIYEVKVKPTDTSSKKEDIEHQKLKKQVAVQKLPEVSKDTFYSVNESIKELFGTSETTTFSFFGSESVHEDTQASIVDNQSVEEVIEESVECETITEDSIETDYEEQIKIPSWKKGLEQMHQCEQTTKSNDKFNCESETGSSNNDSHMYLCIPDDDPRLEIGKSFMRTEQLEEITYQWRSMRRNLTEDYKKKHKDARRRIRKIREKQFGQR